MSRIKEHYHDEIIEMMQRAENEEALEEMILGYDQDMEEVEHSGVPKFLNSKFLKH